MAENLNAAKPDEFPQQSDFRPLQHFCVVNPLKALMRKGSHEVEDLVVTCEQAEIRDTGSWCWGVLCLGTKCVSMRRRSPAMGSCMLQLGMAEEIKIYSQNTAHCILYLGGWAVPFNWFCVITSSSSYLTSTIIHCFGHQWYRANDTGINGKC